MDLGSVAHKEPLFSGLEGGDDHQLMAGIHHTSPAGEHQLRGGVSSKTHDPPQPHDGIRLQALQNHDDDASYSIHERMYE